MAGTRAGRKPVGAAVAADASAGLAALRALARAALLRPPVDPACACAAAPRPGVPALGGDAPGLLLMRALDAAAAAPLVFHAADGAAASFAERWLLRLLAALRAGDDDSARFLVGRAVRPAHRRAILTLAARFALAADAAAVRPAGRGRPPIW